MLLGTHTNVVRMLIYSNNYYFENTRIDPIDKLLTLTQVEPWY
jgi:hypothetical protein